MNQNTHTMEAVNGSHFKLIYPSWVNLERSVPLPNGLHIKTLNWIYSSLDIQNDNINLPYDRVRRLENLYRTNGLYFQHMSMYYYFKKHYGTENIVNSYSDDGSIYFYPIELDPGFQHIMFQSETFLLNNEEVEYNFIDTIPDYILDLIRKEKIKLLIGSLTEPSLGIRLIEAILKIFNVRNIPQDSIIFLNGNKLNFSFRGVVSGFSHATLQQQVEIAHSYPVLKSSLNYPCDMVRENDLNENVIRSKKFICWNRMLDRPHRIAMAYLALKHNLLPDGIFSFITGLHSTPVEFLSFLVDENYTTILDYINRIKEMIPYEVDTHNLSPAEKMSFQTNVNNKKEYYLDSYFHIVSETQFDNSFTPFFSEKTFRPILNLQPFIYIGNYKSLEELKRIGFKTFHPYLNEDYDNEPDNKKRFKMIEEEILRLSQMPIKEIHDLYFDLIDKLIYNQQHFMSLLNYNPLEEFFLSYKK